MSIVKLVVFGKLLLQFLPSKQLAPGYLFDPLIKFRLSLSLLNFEIFSGIVSFIATLMGIPIEFIAIFGSGEITDLPEKSTRFPPRLPLNLPFFPF